MSKVVHEGRGQRDDAEAEGDGRDEPAWPNPLAHDVGRDFEDNVRDVEDGEERIVVVALEAQVPLETGDFGISCHTNSQERGCVAMFSRRILTNICPVDEAKQVKQRHGRDKEQVQLAAEFGLGLGVELN